MSTDDEGDLSVGRDSHVGALPRQRGRSTEPRPGVLWNWHETIDAPSPVLGAFPRRFLAFALAQLEASPSEVLHLCSGNLPPSTLGVRVDIRAAAKPDVVADGRRLPFADNSFAAALIDPPWAIEYARDLYGTDYPRPAHLLREAGRVVRPRGRIGFVHFVVPNPPPYDWDLLRVFGITAGCGFRIRALTIYQRRPKGLFAPSEVPDAQVRP